MWRDNKDIPYIAIHSVHKVESPASLPLRVHILVAAACLCHTILPQYCLSRHFAVIAKSTLITAHSISLSNKAHLICCDRMCIAQHQKEMSLDVNALPSRRHSALHTAR